MAKDLNELLTQGTSLLREAGAREVYVFGSVTQGRMREHSDVDLAVSGLPPEVFYATMARLSDLFDRSVDLVDLDDTTPFVTYLKEKGVLRRVV